MKNLSIRTKLIIAFLFFFVALLTNILINKYNIEESQKGFNEYRTISRASVALSSIKSNILTLRISIKDYLRTNDKIYVESFNKNYNNLILSIEEGKKLVSFDKKTLNTLLKIQSELKSFNNSFFEVVKMNNEKTTEKLNNKKIKLLMKFY